MIYCIMQMQSIDLWGFKGSELVFLTKPFWSLVDSIFHSHANNLIVVKKLYCTGTNLATSQYSKTSHLRFYEKQNLNSASAIAFFPNP